MLTVDFQRLGVAEGMLALDVGCGQGRHSLEFLRLGCPVIALDLIPEDLKYTGYLLTALGKELAEKPDEAEEKTPFATLQGNALHLPFASQSFDRIICSEVLEHVSDPGQTTAELTRVLKPGGMLAVSVPTPFTEWTFRYASDEYFNSPGGHVRIFTPRRLVALLRETGLEVRDINLEHSFHSIYWLMRCVFGLHDENHPVIRHFKKILTHQMYSPQAVWMEKLLDYIFPKSMVLYARKT